MLSRRYMFSGLHAGSHPNLHTRPAGRMGRSYLLCASFVTLFKWHSLIWLDQRCVCVCAYMKKQIMGASVTILDQVSRNGILPGSIIPPRLLKGPRVSVHLCPRTWGEVTFPSHIPCLRGLSQKSRSDREHCYFPVYVYPACSIANPTWVHIASSRYIYIK